MSIMQQSSKAQDCTLGVWFQAIQQGQVKLPRLQLYFGAQDFADSKSASFESILLASGGSHRWARFGWRPSTRRVTNDC